jgi:predicted extracellular nuclease
MIATVRGRSLVAALALLAAASAARGAASYVPTSIEHLGELELAPGTFFDGEPVGGLSGLAWDPAGELFLALSDDRGERSPSRLYALRLDLGRLGQPGGVEIVARVRLLAADGTGYRVGHLDPEGLARGPDGALYFSSEGVARDGIAPFVARLGADGRELGRYELPARALPDGAGRRGVRDNLGFESLAVTPEGRFLVAGLENALVGDGPAADAGVTSPSRLLVWDLAAGGAPCEVRYEVDAVRQTPPSRAAMRVNGLVELLALGDDRLLALEREFVAGAGMRVALWQVVLDPPLAALGKARAGRARKELLLDFSELGVEVDNFEGMTFGPTLADGRRSFVVVSDDNFNPLVQRTRFLVFAADDAPVSIARLQGATHRSPFAGRWVVGVEGVVTAVESAARTAAFFVQSLAPDDDPATSEGVRVEWPEARRLVAGDRVRLHGRVVERSPGPHQLTVTTVVASHVESVERGVALPAAAIVGSGELVVPSQVDDDGLTAFEPSTDAIDFWESREGMRVVADGLRVTGPTLGYDELVVALDSAEGAPRSGAGGDLLTPDGPRLDRIGVSGRQVGGLPQLAVGSRLAQPVEGVVDYSFASYKLLATRPLAVESAATTCEAARSRFWPDPARLRVAAFNVENLSLADPPQRFERLAEAIVLRLGSPEVVALEEIQDDSGRAGGDGIVSARGTLARLVAAIAARGGPLYEWAQIDPELDREGGVPGGNIRVALLFDPARAALPRRGEAGARDAVAIERGDGGPRFAPNPARVAPLSPAFTLASGEGVRRSLAVELSVDGEPWFFVVHHWSSKFDDSRAFGAVQPPERPTAAKRLAQAEVVRAFAEELLAAEPRARLVVLGDLNDVPWAPAIELVSRPPLVNLAARVPEAERYSYNFEGSAQLIDHLIVSPALAAGAEAEIVHLNSDCPESARSSDHDAVVASLPIAPP